MKRILTILLLITVVIIGQEDTIKVYKSGLYVGLSGIYPHYMTITDKTIASHNNFGFGFHLGYDMSEHFGFRISSNYVLLGSFWYENGIEQDNYVNMGTVNIGAVYSILPCELISPFVVVGYGFTYFKSSNPYLGVEGERDWIKDSFSGNQFEFGLGAEFKFWDRISIKAEVDYITASNNKIDGNEHKNEIKGILQSNGDTYLDLKIGASWYFWRGERSKICDAFSIREVITEVPVEVEKIVIDTVYIDNIIEKAVVKRESFVIEKVKFKFDQDLLTKEAELILNNVALVMNKYPEEKFEILGHTDSWGSDLYNLNLSERRAKSVKNYLISKGVDGSRLFTAGCGERMPLADNNTEIGRAINRRIEFSIYDGVSNGCPKVEEEVKIGKKSADTDFKNTEEKRIANGLLNGEQLSFNNIIFKHDSDELTDPSKVVLNNVVNVLNKLSELKLEIQGHTDSVGPEVYNQYLSEKRANSVKNYLVSNGIESDRLTTIGYGESNPITSNGTREGKALNRRIEFKSMK